MKDGGTKEELQRIRRVSDMLCTAHAGLRDRYSRLALFLDLSVLGLSTWLVALAFVEPRIGLSVSPFAIGSQLWGGLLAVSHDRARAGIGAQRKPGLGRPASGLAPEAALGLSCWKSG